MSDFETKKNEIILVGFIISSIGTQQKRAKWPIGSLKMGRVWYLIVSTPDLCTLTYF